MSIRLTNNASKGPPTFELSVVHDVDEISFIAVTIENAATLAPVLDLIIDNASEAEALLDEVTKAVEKFRAHNR